MSEHSRRNLALADLVGIESKSESLDYPNEITIPEILHSKVIDAVDGTAIDRRERIFNAHYYRDKWIGSTIVRGGMHGCWGYHAEIARLNSKPRIKRPHIVAHTHPVPIIYNRTSITSKLLKKSVAPTQEKVERDSRQLDYRRSSSHLPSPTDLEAFSWNSWGTLGNIVCSLGGISLLLKSNPASDNYGGLTTHQANAIAGIKAGFHQAVTTGIQPDTEEKRLNYILATLKPNYTLYSSSELENPSLVRVVPKASRQNINQVFDWEKTNTFNDPKP